MPSTKQKGDKGELLAIEYLQKNGYTINTTNFKFGRHGEIDIIAEKSGTTHFIEVKYRESRYFGTAEEAITPTKLKKFRKTIEYYVVTHGLSFERIQFDAITIQKGQKSYQLKHFKNLEI